MGFKISWRAGVNIPNKIIHYTIFLFAVSFCFSATLYVDDNAPNDPAPGDASVSDPLEDGTPDHPFDAIQKAIIAAPNDTVLVADGTYTGDGNRDIDFLGKAITVQSENGPETCVIDCQGTEQDPHRAFIFQSGETHNSILSGFSIINGYAPTKQIESQVEVSDDGGGISCVDSNPFIKNCRFINNTAKKDFLFADIIISSGAGGAVGCDNADIKLESCVFENCYAPSGGAIAAYQSNIEISNCLFVNNDSDYEGRAIVSIESECHIYHSTFHENSGYRVHDNIGNNASAITTMALPETDPSTIEIRNCILWEDGPIFNDDNSIVEVTYSNVKDGYPGEGNIVEYPWFVDPSGWLFFDAANPENSIWHSGKNYRLLSHTWIWSNTQQDWFYLDQNPCVDASNPSALYTSHDFDGAVRPIDGNNDGQAVSDMGAYEFDPNDICRVAVNFDSIQFQAREDYKTQPVNGVWVWPPSARLSIHTSDTQPLNWTINNIPGWLNVSPTSGVSLIDANDVRLAVDIEGLDVGLYTGSFEIVDTDDTTNQKTITIELLIKSSELRVPENYTTIQEAIDWAHNGETVIVADGTYTGEGNRNIDFAYKSLTVKSQNGPGNCIIDCQGSFGDQQRAFVFDYSHYFGANEIVLSGFKITNGFCYDSSGGGAILCDSISPTINNCIFENCFSEKHGGAIVCYDASPTIDNCVFKNCSSEGNGGAIACSEASPVIKDTHFHENTANTGSAIASYYSLLRIENCQIINNRTEDFGCSLNPKYGSSICLSGGAVFQYSSDTEIRNCLFEGNKGRDSGALLNDNGNINMKNCTFTGNRSDEQYNSSFTYLSLGDDPVNDISFIYNCIFWNNFNGTGPDIFDGNTHHLCCGGFISENTYEINYSCIQNLTDGLSGFGNIEANPSFVQSGYWDPNGTPDDWSDDVWNEGDYHLKSEGWSWDTTTEQWTWNDETSPCIDAGNPGMALGDEPTTLDVDPLNRLGENIRINMGAYGGTSEAGMAPPGWALLCDMDNSGSVNLSDLAPMAAAWLQSAPNQPPDVTRDGTVDLDDILLLAQDWLETTTWH